MLQEKCIDDNWNVDVNRSLSRMYREKQEWANDKPKLDNARRLRGNYFIDPEDGEYIEKPSKMEKKTVGRSSGCGNAVQARNKETLPVSGN